MHCSKWSRWCCRDYSRFRTSVLLGYNSCFSGADIAASSQWAHLSPAFVSWPGLSARLSITYALALCRAFSSDTVLFSVDDIFLFYDFRFLVLSWFWPWGHFFCFEVCDVHPWLTTRYLSAAPSQVIRAFTLHLRGRSNWCHYPAHKYAFLF